MRSISNAELTINHMINHSHSRELDQRWQKASYCTYSQALNIESPPIQPSAFITFQDYPRKTSQHNLYRHLSLYRYCHHQGKWEGETAVGLGCDKVITHEVPEERKSYVSIVTAAGEPKRRERSTGEKAVCKVS